MGHIAIAKLPIDRHQHRKTCADDGCVDFDDCCDTRYQVLLYHC